MFTSCPPDFTRSHLRFDTPPKTSMKPQMRESLFERGSIFSFKLFVFVGVWLSMTCKIWVVCIFFAKGSWIIRKMVGAPWNGGPLGVKPSQGALSTGDIPLCTHYTRCINPGLIECIRENWHWFSTRIGVEMKHQISWIHHQKPKIHDFLGFASLKMPWKKEQKITQ